MYQTHFHGFCFLILRLSASVNTDGSRKDKDKQVTKPPAKRGKSVLGLASVAGSLIQLRVTLQSAAAQLHLQDRSVLRALTGGEVITLESLSTNRRTSTKASLSPKQVDTSSLNGDEDDDAGDDGQEFHIPGYELNEGKDEGSSLSPADQVPTEPLVVDVLRSTPDQSLLAMYVQALSLY
jgi:hypothetical protein